MDPTRPLTKDEALRYDAQAIERDIKRKEDQIQMFQGEITKMHAEIQRLYQIKAIIDANK